jgi:hypothetical protein
MNSSNRLELWILIAATVMALIATFWPNYVGPLTHYIAFQFQGRQVLLGGYRVTIAKHWHLRSVESTPNGATAVLEQLELGKEAPARRRLFLRLKDQRSEVFQSIFLPRLAKPIGPVTLANLDLIESRGTLGADKPGLAVLKDGLLTLDYESLADIDVIEKIERK